MLGRDEVDSDAFAFAFDLAGEDVHRRATDECGDESVCRPLIDRSRRTALEQTAMIEDGDSIAHEERFALIVRHQDPGCFKLAVKLQDFLA